MDSTFRRNALLLLLILVSGLAITVQVFRMQSSMTTALSMAGPGSMVSHVKADIALGRRATLTQQGNTVTLQEVGRTYEATFEQGLDLTTFLKNNGIPTDSPAFQRTIKVQYAQSGGIGPWLGVLASAVPFAIFVLLFVYLISRPRGRL